MLLIYLFKKYLLLDVSNSKQLKVSPLQSLHASKEGQLSNRSTVSSNYREESGEFCGGRRSGEAPKELSFPLA